MTVMSIIGLMMVLVVSVTQVQQGAQYLALDAAQLAVELPLSGGQLVEAGDEARDVTVSERHAGLAARTHPAHVAQLEPTHTPHTHTE